MKILFVYPNHKGSNMLPTGVALLSACLKREGHEIKLFDTTYYHETSTADKNEVMTKSGYKAQSSDGNKIDRLMARPVKKEHLL